MKPGNTKQIIKDHNFRVKKNYGQHFLTDEHVLNKIINACELTKDDLAIEIGPGTGALTKRLAEAAGKVAAVEIDGNLLPILAQELNGYGNVEVINGDILDTDIGAIIQNAQTFNAKCCYISSTDTNDRGSGGSVLKKTVVAANLPYNIAATVLVKLLTGGYPIMSIVAMMQKEVADRLAAVHGNKNYGGLSVIARYYSEPYLVANVPRNCFVPKPKVDSAVVRLTLRDAPPVAVSDETAFFKMVRAAFLWRRKTFVNCMINGNVCAFNKTELETILEKINLPPMVRGEDMSLTDLAAAFNLIHG